MDLVDAAQCKKGRLVDRAIGLGLAMPRDFVDSDFAGMSRAASLGLERRMPTDVKTNLSLCGRLWDAMINPEVRSCYLVPAHGDAGLWAEQMCLLHFGKGGCLFAGARGQNGGEKDDERDAVHGCDEVELMSARLLGL